MIERSPGFDDTAAVQELRLKDKTEAELFDQILAAGESWTPEQREMVESAYSFVSILHADDAPHRNKPYVYHLLRNANRIIGYLHITDPEIIVATLLHDSPEDHPDEIIAFGFGLDEEITADSLIHEDPAAKQQLALGTLGILFTSRVADIVAGVTNAPKTEHIELSYEDSLAKYAEKVGRGVESIEGWLIKFVDWVDNGLGIIYNEEAADSPRLAYFRRKYGLVLPILEARFMRSDIQSLFDPAAKLYVAQHFQLGKERLTLAA